MPAVRRLRILLLNSTAIHAFLAFVTWILCFKIYCKLYRKYKRLPPGPDGLPWIGAFIEAIILKHKFAEYTANKYSKLVTFHYIGKQGFASIHDATLTKEVFSNRYCQDRSPFFHELVANEDDIVRVKYGEQWKERRKLIRSTLLTMEDSNYIDININIFIKKYIDVEIEENMSKYGCINCIKLQKLIRHLTFSMIIKVIFGKELGPNNSKFIEMESLYEQWARNGSIAFLLDFVGFFKLFTGNKIVNHVKYLEDKLDKIVENDFVKISMNNFDINNKETYFDYSFDYISNKKTNKTDITLNQLSVDFRILIQASIDTLSFVLEMGLLNLIKYENIQKEIYNELKKEYKNDFKVEIKRIIKCPKFRSYVNEILRIALPVPMGVGRYNVKDIKILNGKYILPKGSIVRLDLPFMHYQNGINGKNINLNNWLSVDDNDKDKLIFKNRKKDIFPFSTGHRDCVGRSLALRLLYSILATMILKYKFYQNKHDQHKKFKIKTEFVGGAASQRTAMKSDIIIQKRIN